MPLTDFSSIYTHGTVRSGLVSSVRVCAAIGFGTDRVLQATGGA